MTLWKTFSHSGHSNLLKNKLLLHIVYCTWTDTNDSYHKHRFYSVQHNTKLYNLAFITFLHKIPTTQPTVSDAGILLTVSVSFRSTVMATTKIYIWHVRINRLRGTQEHSNDQHIRQITNLDRDTTAWNLLPVNRVGLYRNIHTYIYNKQTWL